MEIQTEEQKREALRHKRKAIRGLGWGLALAIILWVLIAGIIGFI